MLNFKLMIGLALLSGFFFVAGAIDKFNNEILNNNSMTEYEKNALKPIDLCTIYGTIMLLVNKGELICSHIHTEQLRRALNTVAHIYIKVR